MPGILYTSAGNRYNHHMKIYISADIEGISGVTVWDETHQPGPDYPAACRQMTAEVRAACEAALACGATDILVRDAHGTARNIIHADLPQQARLVRNWSGGPLMMMEGLDKTFAAAIYIGYHARSGSAENPLAHTMSTTMSEFLINGKPVSEFDINALAAAEIGVPSVFISGDRGACEQAKTLVPRIGTAQIKYAAGDATVDIHPRKAVQMIFDGVNAALSRDNLKDCLPKPPKKMLVELRFKEPRKASRMACYPNAKQTGRLNVQIQCRGAMEILKIIQLIYG